MSTFDSILEGLSGLSSEELEKVQGAIQQEREKRKERRYRYLLKSWASESELHDVKYMSFQSPNGWIVIAAIFNGDEKELFQAVHQEEGRAYELAAREAVKLTKIAEIDTCEPMSIG